MIEAGNLDPISRDEVIRMMRAAGRTPSGLRNRAMLVLWWRAGLRLAESLSLRLGDCRLDRAEIVVRSGKGGKARRVPIDVEAIAVLQAWAACREKMPWTSGLVIGSITRPRIGARISQQNAREICYRLARKIKAVGHVHPHGFRHLYALELDAEGVALAEISALLGHSSVKTTADYLSRVSGARLQRRIEQRPAWGGLDEIAAGER